MTTAKTPSGSRLDRWQRRTNMPLLVLAVAFFMVFLLPLHRRNPR